MALIDGLVSYYKLDETSGTTVYDAHGSNDGTNNGATVNQPGKIGTAYDFDGSNDYIQYSRTGLATFTVSQWVYIDTSQTGKYIWNYRNSANNANYGFSLYSGKFRLNSYQGGSNFFDLDSVSNYAVGEWVHVVTIIDGTSSKIYINGVLDKTGTLGTFTSGTDFFLGENGGGTGYFDGKIDEVGIWDRALTSTEVSELYNSGDGLSYPFTTGPDFTKFQINIGDAWKECAGMKINIGDTWKDVAGAKINIGDNWKSIF